MAIAQTTEAFYQALPAWDNFLDLTQPQNYADVPGDWYVLATDVVNSTGAIATGRYREVNLLGASSIIAVLNGLRPLDIPFIFGGDGATLVVPPSVLSVARQALLELRTLARDEFNLELRVGVVPVQDILARTSLRVAKLRLTPGYCQANFSGGGLSLADTLIKTDPTYRIDANPQPQQISLEGLECSWQDIPSVKGHTLSLLVKALPGDTAFAEVYHGLLLTLQHIYGDAMGYHPVASPALKLSLNPLKLEPPTRLQAPQGHRRRLQLAGLWLRNLVAPVLMTLTTQPWQQYKRALQTASDYKKIDDVLRMVIAGSPQQTQRLQAYLDQQRQQGRLVYGVHVSNRALMTCCIQDFRHRHFHFIDGADGGYALAARQMKAQLKDSVHRLQGHCASRPSGA